MTENVPNEQGGGGVYGKTEEDRMIKLFFQIAENLENNKLAQIKDIIKDAIAFGSQENESASKDNLRKFYNIVTFKAGISVNLCKQGMRSLLIIQDEPSIGEKVVAPIEQQLQKEFPTLAGMGKIDEQNLQIYLRALEKGKEKLKHIRLMVVGMFGVGKTCLVRRLRNEKIDDVKSTVGIEINVKVCELDDDGSWIKKTDSANADNDINRRVNDVVVNHKSEETSIPSSSQNQKPKPRQHSKQPKPIVPEQKPQPAQPMPAVKHKRPRANPAHKTRHYDEGINAWRKLNEREEGKKFIENVSRSVRTPRSSGRKPTVSVWDFAGQSVYYSTHHFFISSRSIYLLVLDISKDLDEIVKETESGSHSTPLLQGSMKKNYTCLDAFKFWVTSIYAYTQYRDDGTNKFRPTIILIGTHGDKLNGTREEKELFKDQYFDKARESFDKTPVEKLFHKKTFLVSCTEDDPAVFDTLKDEIADIARQQPYWDDPIPAKWLPLERSIELEKKNKKPLMKFNEVTKADADNELKLEDKEEIKLFLTIQHFLGNAMYFDAPDLDETIILDPQWIIDMFKLFVTHQPEVPTDDGIRDLWKDYQRTAKLTQKLLDFIIEKDAEKDQGKINQFKEHKRDLVGYMEHLDVIAKPLQGLSEDFHIVPCVLKHLTSEDVAMVKKDLNLPKSETGKSTPVLCFVFNHGCLPPSVFHRLLATYIKKKEIKMRGGKYILYNGFGAFKLDNVRTLCIWYADFIIYARVTLHDRKNEVLYTEQCIALREELKNTISVILQLDQRKQIGAQNTVRVDATGAFTEHIMCEEEFANCQLSVPRSTNRYELKLGLHEVESIKTKPSMNCCCPLSETRDHNIYKNDALMYWYQEPEYLKQISQWFKDGEKKFNDFLTENVKTDDCYALSKFITEKEFTALGKLLELEESLINTTAKLKETQIDDKVEKLLCKWIREKDHKRGELKKMLYLLKENVDRK